MNILFITHRNVNPHIGGIERVTYDLVIAFKKQNLGCYSAYLEQYKCDLSEEKIFERENLIPQENRKEFFFKLIQEFDIRIVIAQGSDDSVNGVMSDLSSAVKSQKNSKLIFSFHTMPGFEQTEMNKDVLLYGILHGENIVYNAKYLLYHFLKPILKRYIQSKLIPKYRNPYLLSDRVVVLNEKYRETYAKCADVKCTDKICSIPNIYMPQTENNIAYEKKEKMFLWVGRFDERAKRLSLALKVWKSLEKDVEDWTFRIVGYGENESYYRTYVESNKLKNVFFEGFQNPFSYYKRASVFLMTSAYEGFPMVLLEALGMGVIPICFDSFTSLYDIIDDGENGFIVKNDKIEQYCEKVKLLMANENLRERMSQNARSTVERFNEGKIVPKWINLFDNLK